MVVAGSVVVAGAVVDAGAMVPVAGLVVVDWARAAPESSVSAVASAM